MKILITGAGGLIGSEAVDYYCSQGHEVYGIDNNQRQIFFGEKGSTLSRLTQLKQKHNNFTNYHVDIRDKKSIADLFKLKRFDVVIHTAAQPSHDKAASIPFEDFETNANGTLHLLEAVRQNNKDCIFIQWVKVTHKEILVNYCFYFISSSNVHLNIYFIYRTNMFCELF